MTGGMDVERVALAIEADMGEVLPDLRQALTEAKAGQVGRQTTPEQALVCAVRHASGMSQVAFAARIATPVATLRDWEQGRFSPPGVALCLLRLLDAKPELLTALPGQAVEAG